MVAQQRSLERKERIVDAALEMIIERGVHATTHRAIAEVAEVPLGSVTYYFTGLSDLFVHAFERLYTRMAAVQRDGLQQAETLEQAIDAFTDMICGERYPGDEIIRGLVELYSYANHNDAALAICRQWLATTRETLLLHFPGHTVAGLDALLEGWHIHQCFSGTRVPQDQVRRAVQALVTQ